MTKERARQILRRVWVEGHSLVPSEWAELEHLPGDSAFERCMGAAGIPEWEHVMSYPWPERADEVARLLANAERVA